MQVIFTKAEVMASGSLVSAFVAELDLIEKSVRTNIKDETLKIEGNFKGWVEGLRKEPAVNDRVKVSYSVSSDGQEVMIFTVSRDYVIEVNSILTNHTDSIGNVINGLIGVAMAFKAIFKSYNKVLEVIRRDIKAIK